jgi:hypothetical protein
MTAEGGGNKKPVRRWQKVAEGGRRLQKTRLKRHKNAGGGRKKNAAKRSRRQKAAEIREQKAKRG